MASRTNPKREKQIEAARKIAAATGETHLDPEILFGRASNDDMERYSPEMLALAAVHAARELAAWSGASPRVNIEQVANIDPDGMPVSILSITDHNMPFLYESATATFTWPCIRSSSSKTASSPRFIPPINRAIPLTVSATSNCICRP
jgi:glutamate dehydrogenase